MIGPTNRKNWLTFGGAPIPDTDSADHFSISLTTAEQGILDLLAFLIQLLVDFYDTWRND